MSAPEAAAALVRGFGHAGVACDQLPIADGGDGTLDALHAALGGEWRQADVHDAFGRPRQARWLALPDGGAVVESAEAIPLDTERADPMRATSRGLGELLLVVGATRQLIVGLGGTATMDAGAGLLDVLESLPAPTVVLCDARTSLYDAPRTFGPQKGASPHEVGELEKRFRRIEQLRPHADKPGAGAAGGLGAALASLGAQLVSGSSYVLERVGFDPGGYAVAVTGEGIVDATTADGKAPGEVCRRALAAGVRCAIFGGRVDFELAGAEMYPLSGRPERTREDLVALGEELGRTVG